MKKISYILCVVMLMTSLNAGVLADNAADFAIYEDFAYSVGAKLNSCPTAVAEDEIKGFSGGWKSDAALSANPSDSFVVAQDGKVSVNTNRSDAIYRQMTNSVDLSRNSLYCISATMKINSKVTLDNTHTVKVFLTRQGVSQGAEQLQFGFQGGYGTDKHYSPYMRTKDSTANSQKTVIEPEKTYKLVIKINSNASSDDIITYSVYDDDGGKIGEIQSAKALSDVYDVVAYQEYLGGSLPNEFGNLRIECYGEQTVALINEAQQAVDDAKADTVADKVAAAQAAADNLPDGIIKDELNGEIAKLTEIIEKENRLVAEIEAKIAEVETMEITIDNYAQADEAVALIRENIEQLNDDGLKEKYTLLADELEKNVIAKKISVLKVNEKFDYENGTKANTVGADVPNGWTGGYYADADLQTALDDLAVFGKNEYVPNGMIYRNMYYPVTADDDNLSYIKWEFSLGDGGLAQVQIGDVAFGADTAAFAGEKRSAAKLESGVKYTAVLSIAKGEAKLAIYSGVPLCSFDVAINAEFDGKSVIGIGGNNCTFYSIEKENIPLKFISETKLALESAEKTIAESDIETLREKASALEKCIFKDFALGCADGFLSTNKNTVPVIRSAGVDGVAYASSTVKAKYVIDDAAGNFGSAQITWHCNGNTAVGESYRIPSGSGGADVYFVITVSNKWGVTSQPYTAQSVSVISQPGSGSVSGGTRGGSSGGISGGIPTIKTPDPIPIESDDAIGSPFGDIKGHWAQSIIENLYAKGVVKGVSDNEFKPDDSVTRAEFTALVVNALSVAPGSGESVFSDVTDDDWYASAVKTAASAGIVNGSNGSFRPNDAITREETAKICCAVMDYIEYTQGSAQGKALNDISEVSAWAVEYVEKAVAAGIMNGDADGSFRPHGNATRAESAALASRLAALKK